MHEYRDTPIAKEMKALKPNVSEMDLHVGTIVAGSLPEYVGALLIVGAHETMIPAVLGGLKFNIVVYALVTHTGYMERQWHNLRLARQRYDGRCLARPLQSPYRAMAPVTGPFRQIVVLPDAEFEHVEDYCISQLAKDGLMIVAQKGTSVDTSLQEEWKIYLKKTKAGYCNECDEEDAHWVVVGLRL